MSQTEGVEGVDRSLTPDLLFITEYKSPFSGFWWGFQEGDIRKGKE